MISSDYTLELCNVYHSGQVEPGTCMQRVLGSIKTGVILKDVSLTLQSGEVLAVLGSKGSGKRALLDVISRRVQGPTRGQILLNNVPMSLSLFQERCGYVTHKCDLIPSLTVQQTLHYTATKMTGYLKQSKVKQVMADLALTQVANRACDYISQSEYRRLMIGVQLIKDPVILLLDEPTWDLDPLNTYLVISILSNASKKYGAAVILTMEKPRSDVFPFLDRVLYLCLGDVVYTGGTKQMLEYFNNIGFPCPQLENPLMYYLCLSTVDRRSRERFIESNHQIAALVQKFKLEGGSYKKGTSALSGATGGQDHGATLLGHNKLPLSYGNPSCFQIAINLYTRLLAATFNLKSFGVKQLFLRLFSIPLMFLFLWIFYFNMANFQRTFVTRTGLILNILTVTYFIGIINTILIFPIYRTRYYQEAQEGIYRGPLFLLTYNVVSIPFSFFSVAGGAAILFPLIGNFKEPMEFLYFGLILWGCYIFAEQQTIAILMTVQCSLRAAICSIYIAIVYITLSSGILRSIKGLQDWLYYLTYATQTRYAAAYLNRQVFVNPTLNSLPYDMTHNCTNVNLIETSNFNGLSTNYYCRYANGQSYLLERYSRDDSPPIFTEILNSDMNLGITFAFAIGMIVFNKLLYLIPLPTYVKAKFRE